MFRHVGRTSASASVSRRFRKASTSREIAPKRRLSWSIRLRSAMTFFVTVSSPFRDREIREAVGLFGKQASAKVEDAGLQPAEHAFPVQGWSTMTDAGL
jgi:hypothetical protein